MSETVISTSADTSGAEPRTDAAQPESLRADALRTDTIPADCVVLDTETTGFDPEAGNRLIEIGAVRMRGGTPTNERLHLYFNPERTVPEAATKVHGIKTEDLIGKPFFREKVAEVLAFIGDDPMVAHNAGFDAKFLNYELGLVGHAGFPLARFVDSIQLARKKFPGSQANLDALCRRFKISLKDRTVHGALVDSVLLAEVCVELMGGRQTDLFASFGTVETARTAGAVETDIVVASGLVLHASPAELAAHAEMVAKKLGPNPVWNRLEGTA